MEGRFDFDKDKSARSACMIDDMRLFLCGNGRGIVDSESPDEDISSGFFSGDPSGA